MKLRIMISNFQFSIFNFRLRILNYQLRITNYIILLVIISMPFIVSCASKEIMTIDMNSKPIRGFDEKKQQEMLLGEIFRSDLKGNPYGWFDSNYTAAKINDSLVSEIKKLLTNDTRIEIIMGTWCSDTRDHLPHLLKLLDMLNFSSEKISLFCVDRSKQFPLGPSQERNISSVPTIIFFKGENELGRFVEAPQETLEKDILKILSGK
ncbi:MAG: thioredoxin family protein [Ignavibacteriales bacterium]|nr:thioredoxin family protein [Ignavibacteriales bacterium]